MSKIIITSNSVVFNYETKESAFFETSNLNITSDIDCRFIIEYLREYAANGIDIIINGNSSGYIMYKTNLLWGRSVGFDYVIGLEAEAWACGSKRYCEKARNIMAADLFDMISDLRHDAENADDAEWENILEFTEFENNAMCEFDDAIENAKDEIKDAENAIEREMQYGTWTDSEIIADAAQKAYDAILSVKTAADNFCKKMSDYTKCDFGIPDAYSDLFIDTPKFYFEVSDDMSVEDVFYEWLDRNVCGSDDADELRETLFHYLAVA